jgi:4-hydroxybenzoate polyprenyltransferase
VTLLRLVRVDYCLLGSAGVITGAAVNGLRAPTALLAITATAVFFVAASCYAFDDYFDVFADMTNGRRDRPLVTGSRNRRSAAIVGIVCFLLALVAASLSGPAVLGVVAAGGAAALIYNRWLQRAFPLKNLLLAGAFPAPLILGGLASGTPVSAALAWCAGLAYVAGFGFEAMIDIADVDGDRANRTDTLSTRYGTRAAARIAAVAFTAAAVLLFLPYVLPVDPRLKGDLPYLLLAATAASGAVLIARSLLRNQTPAHVFVLKREAFAAVLLGLAAFAVSALF